MPALVRAPKGGSNTETDDDCRRRQFSIGELTVRSSLFDSTVADGNRAAGHGGLYVVGKKAQKKFFFGELGGGGGVFVKGGTGIGDRATPRAVYVVAVLLSASGAPPC